MDDYKRRLYNPLSSISSNTNPSHEGSALFGFPCGNRLQSGCLTEDRNVRLHSCERDTGCAVLKGDDVVHIIPIISRSNRGEIILETGAGGGAEDLTQDHNLELDNAEDISNLAKLCSENINNKVLRTKTLDLISQAMLSRKQPVLFNPLHLNFKEDSIPLSEVAHRLALLVARGELREGERSNRGAIEKRSLAGMGGMGGKLPKKIVCVKVAANEEG